MQDARGRREQALAFLLEGQRHMWKVYRLQTQAARTSQMQLAKPAFLKAVELDPTLSEAYTALAEISVAIPPGDLESAITLATKSITINPQNFGAHRLLARFYTIKSKLNDGALIKESADRAVAEWKEITRLDPRNAEAWAFLSAFAEFQGRSDDQIKALRGWVSSAPAVEEGFYVRRMGGGLSPEDGSLKLAAALAKGGQTEEAATILGDLIADNPRNAEAIGLLGDVVDSTKGPSAEKMVSALQQAVFASPENVSLIDMLARLQNRLGQTADAIALLKKHVAALKKTDKVSASTLSAALGELYLKRDRYPESISAFEDALTIRGIGETPTVQDEEREFTVYIFEKLIQVSKLAEKPEAAKAFIEKARKLLRREDLFSDRQMVMLLQVTGDRKQALSLIRALRAKRPADSGLLRQEALLMTELGQVDDAVQLVRNGSPTRSSPPLVGGGASQGTIPVPIPSSDEFSDLLFISSLYVKANRGVEAVEIANQAIAVASGSERKQIGMTALATAYQANRDYDRAEQTLREVLKVTPSNPMALNNLGYFLVERGERLDEASDMIRKALLVDPSNSSYLDSLGWALFKLGKYSEAEEYLNEAARADADSSTIREHLGDLYKQRNDATNAKLYWERALRLSSDPVETERLKKKLGK